MLTGGGPAGLQDSAECGPVSLQLELTAGHWPTALCCAGLCPAGHRIGFTELIFRLTRGSQQATLAAASTINDTQLVGVVIKKYFIYYTKKIFSYLVCRGPPW